MDKLGLKVTSSLLLCSMLVYTSMPVFGYTKEESVYSKLDANGNSYKTTVSSHIKNSEGLEVINDITNLMNVENVSGNNEVNKDGDTLTWKANGKDIYYEGNTNKELPIDINIKYYLNDEEISKDDIIGKNGSVKIVYEFTNKEERKVVINGKYEKMYVPFVVGMGTIIDNDINKNIEITTGKVIDNGNKSMIFGLAFPGMQESLGIEKSSIEIPSKVEIKMDAKDFKMNEVYIFASPKLIEENDFELLNKLDKVCNMAGELKDASNQLVEGTSELNEGAKKLNEGTNEALDGAKYILSNVKISTGNLVKTSNEETLKQEQIELIKANASEQAVAGVKVQIKTIDAKAEAGINANKETIENTSIASAKQIAEGVAVSTAKEVAGEVAVATAKQTASKTAGDVIDSIGVDVINAGIKQVITEQVIQAVATSQGLTVDQVKENVNAGGALKDVVDAQVATQYNAKKITKAAVVAGVENKFTETYNTGIKNNAISQIDEDEVKEKADAGIDLQKDTISATAVASAKQIAKTTAEGTAISVAEEVGGSVGENVATEVANQVKSVALKEVANNMSKLTDGLTELANGLEKLDNGANALSDGTNQLSEGMDKFDKEGIQKIYDLVNGNVKGIKARVQKLQELADEYNNFSGINGNVNGSVKFIMIIDKLEAQDKKEQVILPEEIKEEKE